MWGMSKARAFFDDKKAFFENFDFSDDSSVSTTLNAVKEKAQKTSYDYLLNEIHTLEMEFDTLYNTLLQKPQNRRKFWLYTYYLSLQMAEFYEAYGPTEKALASKQMAETIRGYLEDGQISVQAIRENDSSFFERLYNQIKQWFQDLYNKVAKATSAKNAIAEINMIRMMYMVSRLTLLNFILILNNNGLIEKIGEILGQQLSLEVLQERLGTLQGVANVLSVALFVGRAAINTALVIKHVCFPSEKEKEVAWYKRFMFELNKNHGQFLNDFAWSAVNLFTNYPKILGLSFPAVIGITVGFLVFDLSLILWLRHRDELKFQDKNNQLQLEIKALMALDSLDKHQKENLSVLLEQKAFLEIDHKSTQAAYHMNIVAAVFLCIGFATGFAMASPIGSVACLGVSIIAVAFYRSANQYADMVRKREMLQKVKNDGGDILAAEKAYENAKMVFANSMLKHTLMPTIILITFALCWQAALVGIGILVVYEMSKGLQKSDPQKSEQETLLPVSGTSGFFRNKESSEQPGFNEDYAIAI